MNDLHSRARPLPDEHNEDTYLKYKPGTQVHITGGQHKGQEGVVDSLVPAFYVDENWTEPPSYVVKMDDGHWLTLTLDMVTNVAPG
jgi:hypothetical protein